MNVDELIQKLKITEEHNIKLERNYKQPKHILKNTQHQQAVRFITKNTKKHTNKE
jgi:hypothetical protein